MPLFDMDIRDYLHHSIVTPEAREELMGYADEALDRIVYTLGLIPEGGGRLLEIGANPYFLTLLIKKYRDYEMSLTNFFGVEGGSEVQHIVNESYGESHELKYERVNVEKGKLPYEDGYFDVVLFCEVLEHLMENPLIALHEAGRVLKDGGVLILSTPNVYRHENAIKFLKRKESIYDPYSGYGAYGRHNREYSLYELEDLLGGSGFEVVHKKTLYCGKKRAFSGVIERAGLGKYIIVKAIKKGGFSWYYPAYLYRGQPPVITSDDMVIMGVNCYAHTEGWHSLETWEDAGAVRWSKKHSVVYVKPKGMAVVLKIVAYAAHDDTPVSIVIWQRDREIGSFEASLSEGWQDLTVDVTLSSTDVVKIDIHAPRTWIPKDEGVNEDSRELGIAVREAGLRQKEEK